jgi:hypothetical protein
LVDIVVLTPSSNIISSVQSIIKMFDSFTCMFHVMLDLVGVGPSVYFSSNVVWLIKLLSICIKSSDLSVNDVMIYCGKADSGSVDATEQCGKNWCFHIFLFYN